MFLKLLMGLVFLALAASQVFAAPGPLPFERFVAHVATKTGKPIEEIRERAIESLLETGNFTERDLARIGREGESLFDQARAGEAVKLLQESASFRVSTGLEALRVDAIRREAEQSFDALARQQPVARVHSLALSYEISAFRSKVLRATEGSTPSEIAAADKEAHARANELFNAVTAHLAATGASFEPYSVPNRAPLIELPKQQPAALSAQLEHEIASVLPPGHFQINKIIVDVMAGKTSFDEATGNVTLGAEFLHGIK